MEPGREDQENRDLPGRNPSRVTAGFQAGWGGIQGLPVRALRIAISGAIPWLPAVVK